MEITFYSPSLELSTPLKEKLEEALDQVVERAGFLEGKKTERKDVQAKVAVEKERGKFKLSLELSFPGQVIIAADKGDDLYLLIDSVKHKLEREIHRYRKKHLKLEKKGSQIWKKWKILPLRKFFKKSR